MDSFAEQKRHLAPLFLTVSKRGVEMFPQVRHLDFHPVLAPGNGLIGLRFAFLKNILALDSDIGILPAQYLQPP